ncbi:MAG: fucose isomerase [Acidobacteria bacterium]|nr:fucose isomerase [Acidobacteriota bacterium]
MKQVYLVTSGDLRQSANEVCWPAQYELEAALTKAFADNGCELIRAFPYDSGKRHGFIFSQRMGMDVFANIPADAPLVFATAAWQYTHHVLPGMRSHRGPMLTVANWSGKWPGLVGLLNLNGSLIKAGVSFSTLWSENFTDAFALNGLREWIGTGRINHDLSHVTSFDRKAAANDARELGEKLATELLRKKIILGVFDEGCMGMYNAIIDDELLNRSGFFKERLSQSALYARMRTISDASAHAVRSWLDKKGLHFNTGKDEAIELTDAQILEQCRMYIAALQIADEFGCDSIGIQYQQGLKDLVPASDLVEGLLNNPDRPPVKTADGRELYAGNALPHFNEVDECAGVDAVITNHCWQALGLDPSTTLHDVRWGKDYNGNFVWLWQISGAAPASHFVDGYAGSESDRQPAMYFPLGGGTLKGIGRPGDIVWSRVFVEGGTLHMDIGLAKVVTLPTEETEARWSEVTKEWPMVSVVTEGVDRNGFMARHRANHVSIAYAGSREEALKALTVKASMGVALGISVHCCGIKL